LEKDFPLFAGTRLGIIGEVFNAFNSTNAGCLANFIPPEGNPNLGRPGCAINLPRRYQLGVRIGL
ncbi:MAG TPA: hypothetical protein VFL80_12525, partial [Thermoanaerobaculia bacterium]|nr:hypothetical protein [Thermoanaerobaculia bacterium]